MASTDTNTALRKGGAAERLTREEALSLFELVTPLGIHALGRAALENRKRRFGQRATFVSNVHINPSNICEGGCGFCQYSRKPGEEGGYVLSEEEILSRIEALCPTEVHIVGGMNRIWDFRRNLSLVRAVQARWPKMHIKAYTAVEIDFFARIEGMTTRAVLKALKSAGISTLPGGGAELFSARMREAHCPMKLRPDGWLRIHEEAHGLEIPTNATMLYGLDETPAERIDHLLQLRDAQDRSGGFACFIPLPFQPGRDREASAGPSPLLNLAVVAIARLVLDNINHIKAYWPMIGLTGAAVALSFGADDLDGTIGEERIAHAAGAATPKALSRERMVETIRIGGFDPHERDGAFNDRSGNAGGR